MFSMSRPKEQQDKVKYDRVHLVGGDTVAAELAHLIANPPEGSVKTQITPKLAAEMLKYNDNNRPISAGTIAHYANQMIKGDWHYTRVPVIFSDAGRLIDGQHRLNACVASEIPIWNDVAFGAPDDAFAFVDIGKKRSAGDIFSINGVKNGVQIAAITQTAKRMAESGTVIDGGKTRPTNAELYEFYIDNLDIDGALPVYRKIKKSRLATPSLMAGIYVIMARKCRRDADLFFDIVADGYGASTKNHPALVLRKQMIDAVTSGGRLGTRTQAGLTITAWNRMRDQLSGRGLKFNPENKMPRVR